MKYSADTFPVAVTLPLISTFAVSGRVAATIPVKRDPFPRKKRAETFPEAVTLPLMSMLATPDIFLTMPDNRDPFPRK